MKITSVLLLAICLHVSASTYSQSVTFSGREVPMKKVFAAIKRQTGYVVWGKSDLLRQAGTISASVQNMPLLSFLDLIVKDQPFQYRIADNTIFLYGKFDPVPAEEEQAVKETPITGRIIDSTGVPLIGATIVATGGGRSAITDADGKFTIPVNEGSVVRISFIGFKTRDVTISARMLESGTMGNLVLSMISSNLTELNVTANTGYQSIPKERATGAFSVITEETLGARMQTSLISRLEGAVPGLFLQNGAVNLRGISTLYGTQSPLFVVDGFPYEGDLNYLNPNDIVNVTVLKDAAATSIYGTRAANGVISITTRHGSARKLTVNFSSTAFLTPKSDAGYLNFMNSKEMVDMEVELFHKWHPSFNDRLQRSGKSKVKEALYDHEQGNITKSQLDDILDKLRSYDGQSQVEDLYMRNQFKHRESFSVNGGTDAHQYNIFMNYTGSSGYGLRDRDEAVNVGLNDRVKVFKWLDAEIGMMTNISNGKFTREGPTQYYTNLPYEIMRYPDGSPAPFTKLKSPFENKRLVEVGLYDETYYPLEEMDRARISSWSNHVRIQGGFTARIIRGLTLDLKYQTERGSSYGKSYYTPTSYYTRRMINDAAQIDNNGDLIKNIPDGGQIFETRASAKSYTARGQLNFDREVAPRHRLTAIAGTEWRAISNSATKLSKMGYNDNNLQFQPINEVQLGSLKNTQSLDGTFFWGFNDDTYYRYGENRYVSFYGNFGYTFDGKYNLTGSARVDDSNLFGVATRDRRLPVWHLGASWRLTEEDFMKNINWLNNLALRTTYGLGGNVAQTAGPYLQASSSFFNDARANATDILYPPNGNLRWEKTASTNIGIDFAVLNNRIYGSVDYYIRKTTDLLGEKLTDPTNAFPFALINYGSMNNKGLEIALNTRNFESRDFNWNTMLNLTFNKSRMTDINLRNPDYRTLTQGWGVNRIGYPMDAVFSFRYAGLDPTNGTVMVYDADGKVVKNYDQSGTVVANMQDVNGLVYSGTLRPKWTSGFTNTFNYKQLTLRVMMIANGGHVLRDVASPIQNNFGSRNEDKRLMNFWRKPGDERNPNTMPAPDLNADGREYYTLIWFAADRNVLKGDYLKVRDISLSYDFAKMLQSVTKLSSAKFTLQVQNPFSLFRNDQGIDPEAYQLASQYANRTLWVSRVYMAGIDITF
ncbi:SusC/RagA family TonB-linked outer membrane protein [Chitinophaga rhizosphaerae]|uniref:SusC/RagA family TonB-linked outer membrane protein n=1 Tax=Chitinophaga rhizosphaerae TaxID=1864947 RepID=UPI0013DEF7A8|nr:SusC/RagA family TonB-linked outer membrane protein [Chitinophaga rhizosphaerae]